VVIKFGRIFVENIRSKLDDLKDMINSEIEQLVKIKDPDL